MKTITIKVYSYDELSDEAKAKARQWGEEAFSSERTQDVTDAFQNTLAEYGYPHEDCRWSLNYCQGDGVAFYGDLDLDKLAERKTGDADVTRLAKELRRAFNEDRTDVSFVIAKSKAFHHYDHYNTMLVESEYTKSAPWIREKIVRFEKEVQAEIKELSKQMTRNGYKILEDKSWIEDTFRANDYWFTHDGKVAPTRYAEPATHQVVDFGNDLVDSTQGYPFEGTEAECEAWIEANLTPEDRPNRYGMQVIPE